MVRGLAGMTLRGGLLAGMAALLAVGLRADEPAVVDTLADLEALVDVAYTNRTAATLVPPGPYTFGNWLGLVGFTPDFTNTFPAGFAPVTNGAVVAYPGEVSEEGDSTRLRIYRDADGVPAHTSVVSLVGYPEAWIEGAYGEPPGWLTGTALTNWYADRDPGRQRLSFMLMPTGAIPAYISQLADLVEGGGSTNPPGAWTLYSNAIAFVTGPSTPTLLLHAPAGVASLDVFASTNLSVPLNGWWLEGVLAHTTDPIPWPPVALPRLFLTAGDAELDTDDDGLSDARELRLFGTDPSDADSDGDGLSDWLELMAYGLDPLSGDSDGDGIPDALEVELGTSPGSADTFFFNDTATTEIYTYFGYVDPLNKDSDDDGLEDGAEIVTNDTYAAPACSGAQDSDGDGLSDYAEVVSYGTNPRVVDTDGDGIDDGYEIAKGWDPLDSATGTENADGDAYDNVTEYEWDFQPTSSNATPPTSQRILVYPAGTNQVRHSEIKALALGDTGPTSTRLLIRPFWKSGALSAQSLYHTRTPGFTIDGVSAASLDSPIIVPAAATAHVYRIASDVSARGTNLHFRLTNPAEPTLSKDTLYCYYPEVTSVNFWGPGSSPNYVDVYFGQTNTLWIGMPADTNACRLRMSPGQSPSGLPYCGVWPFYWTDGIRVRVIGPGAEPTNATLNTLDWRSAHGVWYNDSRTRGIRLDPGAHTVQVGYDMNLDGMLEPGEVQETCHVHVPLVDINGDYNRDGNPADHANEADVVSFDGLKGMVIIANSDDDDNDGEPDGDKSGSPLNYRINGASDLADVYALKLAKLGIPADSIPSDMSVLVEVLDPDTEEYSADAIAYMTRQTGELGYSAFNFTSTSTPTLADKLGGTGTAEIGLEGRKYGAEVLVRMTLKQGTTELCSDEIRVLIAPFFVLSNCDVTTKVYSGAGSGPGEWPLLYEELTNALDGVVEVEAIGSAVFIQDRGEIGYTRLPPGMATGTPTTVMDRGDPAFKNMVSSNTCYFYFGGMHGGSLEAAPPTPAHPYGSIIIGSTNLVPTEAFLLNQAVQSVSNSLITLPADWLIVGHADEVFAIIPSDSGFAVLVADLDLAIELLEDNPDKETGGGYTTRASILASYAANTAKVALVQTRLSAVRASLSAGLGIPESQFIRVPVAFSVNDWYLAEPRARAVLPNLVNMLVVKNTSGVRRLILPDPFFEPFADELEMRLADSGYVLGEVYVVDTTGPHSQGGEVHCATIAGRVAP